MLACVGFSWLVLVCGILGWFVLVHVRLCRLVLTCGSFCLACLGMFCFRLCWLVLAFAGFF